MVAVSSEETRFGVREDIAGREKRSMTRHEGSFDGGQQVAVDAKGEEPENGAKDVFVFPASFSQQRLWFLDQLEPGSPAYNINAAIRVRGGLDVDALRASLQTIVARHESLRTIFASIDGEPSQVVMPDLRLEVPIVDLGDEPVEDREPEIVRRATEEAKTAFDLATGPLIRAQVLALSELDHVLLLSVHHIVADGWSMGIIYNELSALYAAAVDGRRAELPELEIQYVDYAFWQKEFVEGEEVQRQLSFWTERFGGTIPVLELPKRRSRPASRTSVGAKEWIELDPELVKRCVALCRAERATPYMLFLAALEVLFHKYSGQDDIIVGSPIANRLKAEIEASVGFYVNTVAYRSDFSKRPTFRELLRSVQEFSTQVYSNQDVPFEKVIETLNPDRDLSHNPLFQAMFTMQSSPDEFLKLPGLEIEFLEVDNGTSKFDLLIELQEKAGGIEGYFEYSTEIFEADTIRRMSRHYGSLLSQLVGEPDRSLGELSLMPRAESEQVVDVWNRTGEAELQAGGVARIFREAAREHALREALRFRGRSVRYDELDRRSNQVARLLLARGVERGSRVGITFHRSIEMVAAVLGTLKAGAAYVPIDPDYPEERRRFIAEDAKLSALLSNVDAIAAPSGIPLIRLDAGFHALDGQPAGDPEIDCDADDLAYVIYTSGSTGQPKGVAMPHGPLANLVSWQLRESTLGAGSRTLQFASMSFDVSFQELFSTFAAGGTLVLITEELRKSPADLLRLLDADSVERIFLPYIALQQLAEVSALERIVPASLRDVITAGEQLHVTPAIVELFQRLDGATLANQYGPSESHVVTCHTLRGDPTLWPAVPPIGKPITAARVYVLDRDREPVPVGVTGELYLGGDVIALGYLDRPELTEERFVADPFRGTPGARMYKTGDLARFLADGSIEFLGRNDHQVKIRGYRVEPDEIETALERVDGIREAFVTVEGQTHADRRLVAYVVPDGGREITAEAIRSGLESRLPEFMVPGVFYAITTPPLTPSGKVDRARLARCESARLLGGATESIEPRDEIERELSDIWQEVLGVTPIGVRDNFFELGGHSILAVRVMARVKKSLRVDVPLATLFRAPTVEALATLVRETLRGAEGDREVATVRSRKHLCLVEMQPNGSRPPLFCVHGVGGNVLRFSGLVRSLGEDQPCYGLQALGVDGKSAPHTSLEEMAAFYVQEIQVEFPQGPYMVCGYSSGGVVAYEMAKQLERSGRRVALLALFDTYHPDFYADDSDRILIRKKFRESGVAAGVAEFFRVLWRHQTQRFKNHAIRVCKRLDRSLPQFLVPHNLALHFYEASKVYQAGDFSGEIVLFRTTANAGDSGEDLGWARNAAQGVRVIKVPGTHDNFLLEPHVDRICEHLVREIAARV